MRRVVRVEAGEAQAVQRLGVSGDEREPEVVERALRKRGESRASAGSRPCRPTDARLRGWLGPAFDVAAKNASEFAECLGGVLLHAAPRSAAQYSQCRQSSSEYNQCARLGDGAGDRKRCIERPSAHDIRSDAKPIRIEELIAGPALQVGI